MHEIVSFKTLPDLRGTVIEEEGFREGARGLPHAKARWVTVEWERGGVSTVRRDDVVGIGQAVELDVEIEPYKPGSMPWASCSWYATGQTVEVIALPANGERIEHRTWHMPRADLIYDGSIFFDSQGFPHRMRAFDDPRCVSPLGPAGLGSEPAPDCDRLSQWPKHCIVMMREHEWDEWRPVVRPDAFDDLSDGPCLTIAAYSVRPRPGIGREEEHELSLLAESRGLGETLAVDGDTWGGACVVVSSPRAHSDRLVIVYFDPEMYPALARACEVRVPSEEPDFSEAVTEDMAIATGGTP